MARPLALFVVFLLALPGAAQSPWREGYDAALADAKRSGKPVVLDFTAEWCGACKVLDKQAFADPGVSRTLTSDFVAVRVDCDREREVAERFGVRKLPTLIVVSPDGVELARRTGSAGAAEIAQWLNPLKSRAARPPAADPWAAAHRRLALALGREPSAPQSR